MKTSHVALESQWLVNYGNGMVSNTNNLDSEHTIKGHIKIIKREPFVRLNECEYFYSLKSKHFSIQTQVQGAASGTPPQNALMIT